MNLKGFYKENAKQIENVKYVVSERFLDDDGKPVEWEIKCLFRMDEEAILKTCIRNADIPRRGLDIDNELFTARLVAHSVVYPDLNKAELQDTYGVMSADELVRVMLTAPEYTRLVQTVRNIGAKQISIKEKLEEFKKLKELKELKEINEVEEVNELQEIS